MELEQILRQHRKALVVAAERAVAEARRHSHQLPDKTQFNRLISVCGEATCAEEIENYLRYQASRQSQPWPRESCDLVIAELAAPLQALTNELGQHREGDRDRARVAAWRLYAVFLARASTYARAVASSDRRERHGRAR